MNDVTWHILLVTMIVWKLDAIIVDVKTAFLHGDLEEEIYMNFPDGMEGSNNECLLLLKALYGLVQGACQWWKKFIAILKNIDFKGGFADLCLIIKHSNNGTVFASVYVDNFCWEYQGAQDLCIRPQETGPHGQGVRETDRLFELLYQVLTGQEECLGGTAAPHCKVAREVWASG